MLLIRWCLFKVYFTQQTCVCVCLCSILLPTSLESTNENLFITIFDRIQCAVVTFCGSVRAPACLFKRFYLLLAQRICFVFVFHLHLIGWEKVRNETKRNGEKKIILVNNMKYCLDKVTPSSGRYKVVLWWIPHSLLSVWKPKISQNE